MTNDDLIRRQDAIDGVKTLHDVAWKNWHEPTLSANVVLDMIMELPSAQPEWKERKSGEWIDEGDPLTLRCNKCGYRVARYNNTNFCPNCGDRKLWVLHNKLGFGRIRLNRFKEWFNDAAEFLTDDWYSWGDLRKTLEDETGIETQIRWFGKPVKNEETDPWKE